MLRANSSKSHRCHAECDALVFTLAPLVIDCGGGFKPSSEPLASFPSEPLASSPPKSLTSVAGAPSDMSKKNSSKKALALSRGSSSIQAQAVATSKTLVKCLGKFDLHLSSDKFKQTLELWATMSTEESINRVYAGKVSGKALRSDNGTEFKNSSFA
ncbi:hypothetical protein GUJ93_ZPchr0002g25086 [Zizania palustris]|uniref:Uncharacterized protein n=1 Tax=Zizania palustris TaxID=103762 RepID=A0A8J5S5I0_ZIZPA|nr:hypothetical protein GUJ93_ZPchr0002g25086 [Zizania palustris]